MKILGQHVAGLEIRHYQNLRPPRDLRFNSLDSRRFPVDGIVERQRPVEQSARDLSAVRHLAECGGLDRRRDLGGDSLDCRENRDPWRRAKSAWL